MYAAASPRYPRRALRGGDRRRAGGLRDQPAGDRRPVGEPGRDSRRSTTSRRRTCASSSAARACRSATTRVSCSRAPGASMCSSSVVSEEEDVKGVLAKVAVGEADAGFVYATDVRAAGGDVVAIELPSELQGRIEYPVAVVRERASRRGAALRRAPAVAARAVGASRAGFGLREVAVLSAARRRDRDRMRRSSCSRSSRSSCEFRRDAARPARQRRRGRGARRLAEDERRSRTSSCCSSERPWPTCSGPACSGASAAHRARRAAARAAAGRRGDRLLAAFGTLGLLGGSLEVLGVSLPFTQAAVVVAIVFVASPFYIRQAIASFAAVDPLLLDASRTLGRGPGRTFLRVALPLAAGGLAAGSSLAFARGLGEFGATIIFAGSFARRYSARLPLAIYAELDRDFDVAARTRRAARRLQHRRLAIASPPPLMDTLELSTLRSPSRLRSPTRPRRRRGDARARRALGERASRRRCARSPVSFAPTRSGRRSARRRWLDSERGIDLPPERRSVGLVFQDYALFPHLTVAQNVAYGGRHAAHALSTRTGSRRSRTSGPAALRRRAPARRAGPRARARAGGPAPRRATRCARRADAGPRPRRSARAPAASGLPTMRRHARLRRRGRARRPRRRARSMGGRPARHAGRARRRTG